MARKLNLPDLPPVAEFTFAPHRYLWNAPFDPAELQRDTWRAVHDAAPYKVGEVVYVTAEGGGFARAYVHEISCKRDYYGFLRECYIVRRETKAGQWSKRLEIAHPGYVQRGYHRAGLAPEIPEGAL